MNGPAPIFPIYYDCEIVKCIPNRGVSVVCAFDEETGLPRVFCADNLQDFAALIADRLVIGFNNRSFDDRLLAANGILVSRSWDLCIAFRKACGEPEVYTRGVTKAGRKLDDIARANVRLVKTMNGELAPVAWQRKRYGSVIDYCMRDVMILRMLCRSPLLIDPVTMKNVTLDFPTMALPA